MKRLGVGSFILGFGGGGGGRGQGGGRGEGARGGYHIFSIFCSVFVMLSIALSCLAHDSLICLFHSSFFAFLVSGLWYL